MTTRPQISSYGVSKIKRGVRRMSGADTRNAVDVQQAVEWVNHVLTLTGVEDVQIDPSTRDTASLRATVDMLFHHLKEKAGIEQADRPPEESSSSTIRAAALRSCGLRRVT